MSHWGFYRKPFNTSNTRISTTNDHGSVSAPRTTPGGKVEPEAEPTRVLDARM